MHDAAETESDTDTDGGEHAGDTADAHVVTEASIEAAASAWACGVKALAGSLVDATSRLAANRSLSLVRRFASTTERSLQWIHWDDVHNMIGRVVYLDARDRVVWQHPSTKQCFRDDATSGRMVTLIPNAGVGMRRATGPDRTLMPPSIMRALHTFQAAYAGSCVEQQPCCVCERRCTANDNTYLCALCNLWWHASCTDALLNEDSGGCLPSMLQRSLEQHGTTASAVVMQITSCPGLDSFLSSPANVCGWCEYLVHAAADDV